MEGKTNKEANNRKFRNGRSSNINFTHCLSQMLRLSYFMLYIPSYTYQF